MAAASSARCYDALESSRLQLNQQTTRHFFSYHSYVYTDDYRCVAVSNGLSRRVSSDAAVTAAAAAAAVPFR